MQLWCPPALNTNPPAGNDTDHKIHLCMVNAGPPSSGFLCTRRCCCCSRCRHSFCCWQWWRCCLTLSKPWERCSAAASHAASPALLPCKVPLPPGWGQEQLRDLAECLKQFKTSMLGKNKYTYKIPQLQRRSHSSLLSCLSRDRLSVWWRGWKKKSEGKEWTKKMTPEFKTQKKSKLLVPSSSYIVFPPRKTKGLEKKVLSTRAIFC